MTPLDDKNTEAYKGLTPEEKAKKLAGPDLQFALQECFKHRVERAGGIYDSGGKQEIKIGSGVSNEFVEIEMTKDSEGKRKFLVPVFCLEGSPGVKVVVLPDGTVYQLGPNDTLSMISYPNKEGKRYELVPGIIKASSGSIFPGRREGDFVTSGVEYVRDNGVKYQVEFTPVTLSSIEPGESPDNLESRTRDINRGMIETLRGSINLVNGTSAESPPGSEYL